MSKFLPTSGYKWIDPKAFDLNKYTSNSSKWCVAEVDLEYPNKLWELHNHYPFYVWKNDGKLKKQNRCGTCEQQKGLSQMNIQIKLYVTQTT